MAIPDVTTYTDADLESLRAAVLTEEARRWTIATAQTQANEVGAQYAAAISTTPSVPWASLTGTVAPGQQVVWTDGQTYRNVSSAWLPTTASPGTYPQGYQLATPPAPTAPAWAAGVAYAVGALAVYSGVTYKCLQAHTSQVGWEPPNVPALWSPA